jgi:hypothetical protein
MHAFNLFDKQDYTHAQMHTDASTRCVSSSQASERPRHRPVSVLSILTNALLFRGWHAASLTSRCVCSTNTNANFLHLHTTMTVSRLSAIHALKGTHVRVHMYADTGLHKLMQIHAHHSLQTDQLVVIKKRKSLARLHLRD